MLAHSKCSHQARVALPLHTPALPAPRFAAHGQMKSKESTSWFGWWPGLLAAAFLAAWLLLHAGTPSDALTSGGDARRCDCGPAGAAAPSVKPLPEIKLRAMIPLVLEIEKMQTGAELGVQVSWGVGGAHACSGWIQWHAAHGTEVGEARTCTADLHLPTGLCGSRHAHRKPASALGLPMLPNAFSTSLPAQLPPSTAAGGCLFGHCWQWLASASNMLTFPHLPRPELQAMRPCALCPVLACISRTSAWTRRHAVMPRFPATAARHFLRNTAQELAFLHPDVPS